MDDFDILHNAPENATPGELAAYLDEACGDDAQLTLVNAPHGFIYFSPHQALAVVHLERFFGMHLGQASE